MDDRVIPSRRERRVLSHARTRADNRHCKYCLSSQGSPVATANWSGAHELGSVTLSSGGIAGLSNTLPTAQINTEPLHCAEMAETIREP